MNLKKLNVTNRIFRTIEDGEPVFKLSRNTYAKIGSPTAIDIFIDYDENNNPTGNFAILKGDSVNIKVLGLSFVCTELNTILEDKGVSFIEFIPDEYYEDVIFFKPEY